MVSDLTDKEQIELFKKWWRDYGKSIALAILLGLCIGFGWRYWHQFQLRQAEQASWLYEKLQIARAQNQTDTIKQLTATLMKKYARTGYASFAALWAAQDAVTQKNYSQAFRSLQWVMQRAPTVSFRQIARVRAARVLLADQQPQAAMQLLQTVEDAHYRGLIDSVRGDIYTAMGDGVAARKAYRLAQHELQTAHIENSFLQMKATQ